MSVFIKLTANSGVIFRLAVNHIIQYNQTVNGKGSAIFTAPPATDDVGPLFVEQTPEEIDKLIAAAIMSNPRSRIL